jgi:molecular chaperone DnaK
LPVLRSPLNSFVFSLRLIHNVGKNLAEHGDKLEASVKSEIQGTIDQAKALNSDADLQAIKDMISNLTNASMKIGQSIYGNKNNDNTQQQNQSGSADEAEFKDKK